MATAQQIEALAAFAANLDTTDELQGELDGVNARLDALREQIRIVQSVIAEASYTDDYKLELITATLGPQS